MKNDPEFIIFTGPMFGSKTTRLLASIDRYRYQSKSIVAFKPKMDDRYSDVEIVTHSGGKLPAVGVNTGLDMLEYIKRSHEKFNVVAVDEAFMIEGVSDALLSLFREGKTVVVSSLQLSATGNVFEEVRDMMPWATKIEICPAVCTVTGRDAYYTHRKFAGEEITVGGADLYEPRCWEFHSFMNAGELEGGR
jgi:thymidine kinase